MNNQQVKAQNMRFLFITDPNYYAKRVAGAEIETIAFIFSGLMLFIQISLSLALVMLYNMKGIPERLILDLLIYQSSLTLIWLIALLAILTKSFFICYFLTIILQITTLLEIIFKSYIVVLLINIAS